MPGHAHEDGAARGTTGEWERLRPEKVVELERAKEERYPFFMKYAIFERRQPQRVFKFH